MKRIFFLLIFLLDLVFAEDKTALEQNFFKKHIYHHHEIHFSNVALLQSIDNYTVLSDVAYLFFDYFFTENDEIFINTAYSPNNGLDNKLAKEGYSFQAYAGDLKSSVDNINGTGRDYLLELWYSRKINNFSFTAGYIDVSAFFDQNEYSASEQEQFMNYMFVNNPIAGFPSYNLGAYLKLNNLKLSVSDYSPANGYYSILEYVYTKEKYNLRPYIYTTIDSNENVKGIGLSWDFSYEKHGFWGRFGKSLNSNLLHVSAGYTKEDFLFKKSQLGIAYGFNNTSTNQHAVELYYRKILAKHISGTLDIQYIKEGKSDIIYSLRSNIYY